MLNRLFLVFVCFFVYRSRILGKLFQDEELYFANLVVVFPVTGYFVDVFVNIVSKEELFIVFGHQIDQARKLSFHLIYN